MSIERIVLSSSLPLAVGMNAFLTEPQSEAKPTLLSRPQQNISVVNSAALLQPAPTIDGSYQVISRPQQSPHIQSTVPVQGRAARDDYFDTEDPSVNLHDFIINSMQSQKNRVILLKLEEEFVAYITDTSHQDHLKLPPWDSYHRMLAHRVAAYFGLEHNVDPHDKMCVLVQKGMNTRLPQHRFGEYMALHQEDPESSEPKLILKRSAQDVGSDGSKLDSLITAPSDYSNMKSLKTFEEREEEYERARARIFNQQSPLEPREPSIGFDLETPSTRRKSRILPAIMQHRRAASDTSAFLFNHAPLADILQGGTASDHGSRSITPLYSSLNKSAETISRAFGSHQKLDQSPSKEILPCVQKKIAQSSFESHSSVVITPSPPKFTKTTVPEYSPPTLERNDESTVALPQRSNHYNPVQSTVPVLYPHQPGTVVAADPNWYPYQHMMVYQMPAQGYVPTAPYASFTPQIIPPAHMVAINPTYQNAPPGGLIQPTLISTGKEFPQQPRHGLPDMMEQYSSPSQPVGYTLVRPVPQQASPVPGKAFGAWGPSPSFQFPQPVMVQQHSDQGAFTTAVMPLSQDVNASRLADQVEKSLHISDQSLKEMPPSHLSLSSDGLNSFPSNTSMLDSRYSMDSPLSNPGRFFGTSMGVMGTSAGGNGMFTVTNKPTSGPIGSVEQTIMGGSLVSPTLPRGPVQFFPSPVHPHMFGGGHEAGYVNAPGVLSASQGSVIRYPSGFSPQALSPGQPSTPTLGGFNIPHGVLQAHPQAVFPPSGTGIAHSPVQILGHTLGTSLFSPPPPVTCNSHTMTFSHSSPGKVVGLSPDTSPHPPIGTGTIPDSPVLVQNSYNLTRSNGVSQGGNVVQTVSLPPRLSSQNRQQRSGANRYQNQRHPANRSHQPGAQELPVGLVNIPDQTNKHMLSNAGKKEALLPTPPAHQIVKLDTSLTCGVPLNVMEILNLPLEGSPEMISATQALHDVGIKETKNGFMPKTGEKVTIGIFENSESAMQALQLKNPHFVLSIPRSNHARFIMTLLCADN